MRPPNPKPESAVRLRTVSAQQALLVVDRLRGRKTRELPQLDAIPRRLVDWSALTGRGLSRETTYVLSLVDGVSTVETIIDASAMSPLVAHEVLDDLLRCDLIGV